MTVEFALKIFFTLDEHLYENLVRVSCENDNSFIANKKYIDGDMQRVKKLDRDVSKCISTYGISSLENIILELVENAVDAECDAVTVRLNLSKNTLIVSDNGRGMTSQELDDLGSGCTSKIRNLNDIGECKTYGFRGQLLANIAKISHLSIVLHPRGEVSHRIEFGGNSETHDLEDELINPKNCNFYYLQPHHTHIIVKDFFYNLPVRQLIVYDKFLLSLKKGLAHLELGKLKVFINQELKLEVSHTLPPINEIFGLKCRFKKVTTSMGKMELTAYISEDTKQGFQFILYNNRPIDLKILIKNICLIQFKGPVVINELFQDSRKMIWFSKYNDDMIYMLEKIFSNNLVSPKKASPKKVTLNQLSILSPKRLFPSKRLTRSTSSSNHNLKLEELPKSMNRRDLKEMQVINQINKAFILVRSKGQLFMIDQHAMDERIRIENLFRSFFEDMQMITVSIGLTEDQSELFCRFKEYLNQFLRYQDNSIIEIPAILQILPKNKLMDGIMAYIEDIINSVKFRLTGNWFQDINNLPTFIIDSLNSKACRTSVMFGDKLTKKEMMQMIADLSRCHLPFQCAHGRPSIIPLLDL